MVMEHDFSAAGIAMSNIVLMATALEKLSSAEKRGDGLALTNDEVKAVLYTLRTLSAGSKEARKK